MEKFELKKISPAAITKTGNTPKTTKNAEIDFSRGFCFVLPQLKQFQSLLLI